MTGLYYLAEAVVKWGGENEYVGTIMQSVRGTLRMRQLQSAS